MLVKVNLLNSEDPSKIFLIEKEHYLDITVYQSLFKVSEAHREAAYCWLVNADFRPVIKIPQEIIDSIPEHFQTKIWEQLIKKYPKMKSSVYEFLVETEDNNSSEKSLSQKSLYRAVALLGSEPSIILASEPIGMSIPPPLNYNRLEEQIIELAKSKNDIKVVEYLQDKKNISYNNVHVIWDGEQNKNIASMTQYYQFLVQSSRENKDSTFKQSLDELYKFLHFFVDNNYIHLTLAIFELPLATLYNDSEGSVTVNSTTGEEQRTSPAYQRPLDWRADLSKLTYRSLFGIYCSSSLKAIKLFEQSEFYNADDWKKNDVLGFYNSLLKDFAIKAYQEGKLSLVINL